LAARAEQGLDGLQFGHIAGDGNLIQSGASGLLSPATGPGGLAAGTPVAAYNGANTFLFDIVSNKAMFFGVLDALRQDNLMKVLAEPSLVCISGRPASFLEGGTIYLPTPQALGQYTLTPEDYGTQVDFVPIVLGNGRIRLEVRPSVSEIDTATGVSVNGNSVPGMKRRVVETGVEMMAGQTLAIAGLLQTRDDAQNQGLPFLSELPYIGALFRNVNHTHNEIELLILVTPELIEAVDADKVPPGGPGMNTQVPNDCELYWKGHLEVPNCSPACDNGGAATTAVAPASYNGAPQYPGMNTVQPETVPLPSPANGSSENPQNRYNPPRTDNPVPVSASMRPGNPPGLIGPIGYDLQ